MSLADLERLARAAVVRVPHGFALDPRNTLHHEAILARAVLAMLPTIRAATTWRDEYEEACYDKSIFDRIDTDLKNAVDKLRATLGDKP